LIEKNSKLLPPQIGAVANVWQLGNDLYLHRLEKPHHMYCIIHNANQQLPSNHFMEGGKAGGIVEGQV
jgi:hypothetical protein